MAEKRFCEISNNIYKESGLLLFALEIVVNGKENGEILLNPGNYKLPKPFSAKNKYEYVGYILASDMEAANSVFNPDDKNNDDEGGLQSFNSQEKEIIAADFHKMERKDDDGGSIENIDNEWLNICQISKEPILKEDIIFKTMEDSMLAVDHIIICGMVENIKYFVMPLRAGHSNNPAPIVILHTELPTTKQWAELNTFP